MKYFLLMTIIFIYSMSSANSQESKQYTTQYDNVDLDEILTNDRLLSAYIKCLLEEGTCTPDGKELKNNLPDAIQNDCQKCTEIQREGADKIMHYIIDHRPADWIKLEEKYQSDGSYKTKYMENKNIADTEERVDDDKEKKEFSEENEK